MPIKVPENSTMAEYPRYRKPRSHNQNQHQPISEMDPNTPSIIQTSRAKSNSPTVSSVLFSTFSPTNDHCTSATTVACTPKKKKFASGTFRGMGCTASSKVSVPAMIRSSANWEETRKVKKNFQRSRKKKSPMSAVGANIVSTSPSIIYNNSSSSSCVGGDLWCGPRIGFITDAASVNCVVSRRPVSGRGKVDGERFILREHSSCPMRRMVTPEDIPYLDPYSMLEVPHSRLDLTRSRHRRHVRNPSPEGLAEIMMLQTSLMMGGRSEALGRFRDWRLDTDNMSYEELLELGDRIGYVSTGLKEDEIDRCLWKTKLSATDNLSSLIPTETDRKCSICQEDYEANDEIGELKCGHFYHVFCIKEWLSQKNCCPVCKTSAV